MPANLLGLLWGLNDKVYIQCLSHRKCLRIVSIIIIGIIYIIPLLKKNYHVKTKLKDQVKP